MARATGKKFYAYALPNGRRGVVEDWAACDALVRGKANARYRGFRIRAEAEAWLTAGAVYAVKPRPKLKKGVYFDAGTGRGNGVEVSVTDERGKDLLPLILPQGKLNRFGKHRVPGAVTNNYGELLGLEYALRIAERLGATHVYGDSKLVIEHWSRGIMRAKELPPRTVKLVREVAAARRAFEAHGGAVGRISGDHNPADLGFH
jgi:hypothetical protein